MPIASGTRFGPYEILSPAGAGGMGEVYKAKDTRLDRAVAIKVLPAHLSQNEERRQRFEREARLVSSLSHPHICALHDVGQQDGVDFLVLEFLEGVTLEQRLKGGPLPASQILNYASEIADALDKAHRQGVVHRDLKPANIMLTKSGAKLLDFGIAKLAESAPLADALTELTSDQRPLTSEGMIVGTFQYMAPEQLEGKEADPRSDIFSLGTVLYEMATGRPAFTGKSKASLVAAIFSSEPPSLTSLQPMTPPALERVVKTCLAKDPDDRWQTAHDLKLQLEWLAEGGSQVGVPAPVVARRRHRERFAWALAAVALLAAAALGVGYYRSTSQETQTIRSFILPPEKSSFLMTSPAALSPDGRRLVFGATASDGKRLLWVRPLDAAAAQPLAGTEEAIFPFWSPDSKYVAFFSQGKLKKIDASGGPAQTICSAADGRGGSWGEQGVIVFTPSTSAPLHRVAAAGGVSSPLTELNASRQEVTHRWPWFLPGGREFLFFVRSPTFDNSAIYLGNLEGEPPRLLFRATSNPVYLPSGYVLHAREGTLMAQPFDARRGEIHGDAIPAGAQVQFNSGYSHASVTVSHTGLLAFQEGMAGADGELRWFDRSGKDLGVVGQPLIAFAPALSPDGRRLASEAVDLAQGYQDIWIYELARGVRTRFTFEASSENLPVWSPDGARLAFASNRGGQFAVFEKAADGAGEARELFRGDAESRPLSWSQDGRYLALYRLDPATRSDIWILPLEGGQKPFSFLQSPFEEQNAAFSPNGRWIAYSTDESGRNEVYVTSFPGKGGQWQVSTAGGSRPSWRRDGKEIYYLASDDKLMAVSLSERGASLEMTAPQPLFPVRIKRWRFGRGYDVTADGKRFVVNTLLQESGSPLTLVVNWNAGLEK